MATPFATIARLLEATKRHIKTAGRTVNMHIAGTDPRGHFTGVIKVTTLHIARQPIGRVIRNANRLFLCVIRDHSEYRSENFFPGDGHLIIGLRKYSRPNKVTLIETLGAT